MATMRKFEKALASWGDCNEFLRNASEKDAATLLSKERAGRCRVQYVFRIYSRFNKMRAQRERAELLPRSSGG